MPDVAALHQAVITTTNNASGIVVVGFHHGPIIIASTLTVIFMTISTLSFITFIKYEKDSLLAFGILSLALMVFCIFGGVTIGTPFFSPTPKALAAHDAACSDVLDAISSGKVRWMNPQWQKDVSYGCGEDRFAAAANSSSSRYASRM